MNFQRQTGIFDPQDHRDRKVNVIGVGAVGSFVTLALAKMGIRQIEVWDGDKVEEHNLPNQFYRSEDVNEFKVNALQDIVWKFAGVELEAHPMRYEGKERLSGVVIVAVDSMDARQQIWLHVRRQPLVELLVDIRMGAEVGLIYTIRLGTDNQFYEDGLHPSSEALHAPCTAQSIVYTVLGTACYSASIIKSYLLGQQYPREMILDFKLGTLIKNERR